MTLPTNAIDEFVIERARFEDSEALLKLYRLIYGESYPIAYGSDPELMRRMMESDDVLWLVARERAGAPASACVVFELDRLSKIGKVGGLVVDPVHRKRKLASRLVSAGTAQLLHADGPVNSIYTTARTQSVSPQLVCLRDGFLPLGIFPNAHKIRGYETLTLMAKFKPGVLDSPRRSKIASVPQRLGPILEVLETHYGVSTQTLLQRPTRAKKTAGPAIAGAPADLEFEFIDAPEYVRRKFVEEMRDPYDRFYPFHTPNFLMVSRDGSVRIYAYFSKADHYCAIVGLNVAVHELSGRMGRLLEQLKDLEISYLEILMDLEYTQSIEAALKANFLPSAIYPAMRETEDGQLRDFVVLSRTMEMLDFKGMQIHREFKPFIDQYVELWKEMHLETLDVVYESKPSFV